MTGVPFGHVPAYDVARANAPHRPARRTDRAKIGW